MVINTDTMCSAGASSVKCINIGKVDVSYKETPSDEGYVYLQNLSREETIKVCFLISVRFLCCVTYEGMTMLCTGQLIH